MSNQRSEGRAFTFVEYDINRRGVTQTARAHLMKNWVKSKREARSAMVSRYQFSSLRRMGLKEDNHLPNSDAPNSDAPNSDAPNSDAPNSDAPNSDAPNSDAPNTRPTDSGKSDQTRQPRMSHYATVIDFQRDGVRVVPLTRKLRSARSKPGTKSKSEQAVNVQENASDGSPCDRKHGPSRQKGRRAETPRLCDSPYLDADSPISSASTFNIEQICSKSRRTSMESRSELGRPLLECLRMENTPPPQQPVEESRYPDLDEEAQRVILQALQKSVERSSIVLTSTDHSLVRYFAVNAGSMLGLDIYPEIIQKHNPVLKLFLPSVISSQWCFETIILLFSANHYRRTEPAPEVGLLDAENGYLASRQNLILARTRERISALSNYKDSSDDDVVAFLFLAISEYRAGDRQVGLMHFEAWKAYCKVRCVLGIRACGLRCRIIVWWCMSVMCEDDVSLEGILHPATRARMREDPETIFRYFEDIRETHYVEGAHLSRPELVDMGITC